MLASRTTLALACCSAFSLSAIACKKNDRPVVLVELRDKASDGARYDKAKLEQRAVKTLESLPGFSFRRADKDEHGWQYIFTLQLLTERTADADLSKKHRAAGVAVELIELGGPGRFSTSGLETADEAKEAPFEPLIERALLTAASRLVATIEIENAGDEAIVKMLSGTDEEKRSEAVLIAGRRKLKAAVPQLMKIVANMDEKDDVILKAVGALVAIGDPQATSAVIEAGRRRSPAYLSQILFAVSALGGREAEAYLFTVQSGHPDPQVRHLAEEALRELEARREKKP